MNMIFAEKGTDCDLYAPGKAVKAKGRVLIPCAMAGVNCHRHKGTDCYAIYCFS